MKCFFFLAPKNTATMNSMVERPLKKTTLVVAIVVKKRTLGQISFIMQKQTDNPVLSMISCTVQKQMVQKCSKKNRWRLQE
jgi:aspartyl/asparaginyl-tRNA synthetase